MIPASFQQTYIPQCMNSNFKHNIWSIYKIECLKKLTMTEKVACEMISFSIIANVYHRLYKKKMKLVWDMCLANALTDSKK